MKNLLLVTLAVPAVIFFSVSDARSDELVLQDGTVLECKILEVRAHESYRVIFNNGTEVTYPMDKVKNVKITDSPQSASRSPTRHKQDERSINFQGSFNLTISPDYHKMNNDAYETYYPNADTTQSGYGWLGLDLGARLRIIENLTVSPTVGILFNYVSVKTEYYYSNGYTTGYEEETDNYANYIIIPRIAARYQFRPTYPSPYVGVEVNYNKPKTGSDIIEFESGGLGYGAFMGVSFNKMIFLDTGYIYVPVTWDFKESTTDRFEETKNIGGGFFLRAGIAL